MVVRLAEPIDTSTPGPPTHAFAVAQAGSCFPAVYLVTSGPALQFSPLSRASRRVAPTEPEKHDQEIVAAHWEKANLPAVPRPVHLLKCPPSRAINLTSGWAKIKVERGLPCYTLFKHESRPSSKFFHPVTTLGPRPTVVKDVGVLVATDGE